MKKTKIGCLILAVFLAFATVISACDTNSSTEFEAKDLVVLHTWYFTSGIMNNAIELHYQDKNAVFFCTTKEGYFPVNFKANKNVTAKSGETIYWVGFVGANNKEIKHDFVDIILKIDDNIIGYAVIEIHLASGATHNAELLKSVVFPKIDGEYQNVTEKYVKNEIKKVKKGG